MLHEKALDDFVLSGDTDTYTLRERTQPMNVSVRYAAKARPELPAAAFEQWVRSPLSN